MLCLTLGRTAESLPPEGLAGAGEEAESPGQDHRAQGHQRKNNQHQDWPMCVVAFTHPPHLTSL